MSNIYGDECCWQEVEAYKDSIKQYYYSCVLYEDALEAIGDVKSNGIWTYLKDYLDDLHLNNTDILPENICEVNNYILEEFPISSDLLDVKQLACLCKQSETVTEDALIKTFGSFLTILACIFMTF